MNVNDLIFDEEKEIYINIPEQVNKIRLAIVDYLELYDEEIDLSYKKKIVKYIFDSREWYRIAQSIIQSDIGEYGELMTIYLLSEQNEIDFVVGLLFRVKQDIEHGRGMKISLNKMEIIEYGIGEVAFC